MKQIAKLKDEARKHEAKEEWEKAIQAYAEVLRLADAGDGADQDLPLYNRVGDLYVRLGRAAEAVKYYEQAADKYAEAGLFNNAIALCNKALRYDAGRVELLKKLGQFSASQGFFTDARRWYLEYCDRMSKRGAIDQAFQALSELADVHDSPEIRELLARQLKDHGRPEQAISEFRRAYSMRVGAGQNNEADAIRAEINALDPNADVDAQHPHGATEQLSHVRDELPGFLDLETAPPAAETIALDGPVETATLDTGRFEIESTSLNLPDDTPARDFGTIDLDEPLTSQPEDLLDIPLDIGIEPAHEFEAPTEGREPIAEDVFELPTLIPEDTHDEYGDVDVSLPTLDEDFADEAAEPLPSFDDMFPEDKPPQPTVTEFELPPSTSPFSFDLTLPAEETAEPAQEDLTWTDEMFGPPKTEAPEPEPEPEPEPVVERVTPPRPAPRPPEPEPILESEPAFVAETLRPAPPPAAKPAAPAASDYVDLATFLRDDEKPHDTTRFVVAEKPPTGDEEEDFADMLRQFKAKVAETIPKEDAGSHYDLGLAFKEMGLIDEAIAEFQTALRGGEEKLKVYEELGGCFVQKQQYSVAVTILNRALQMPHKDESEMLNVYYHLGRAHEELGHHAEARNAYERVISVDIGFQDTTERLAKL